MDIDKEAVSWIGIIAGWAFTFGGLFAKQQGQGKRLEKVEKVLSPNEDGRINFITHPEHDKLQTDCRAMLHAKIDAQSAYLANVDATLNTFIDRQHERDDTLIKTVASLEATINERIK